jgi:hypothetical protein
MDNLADRVVIGWPRLGFSLAATHIFYIFFYHIVDFIHFSLIHTKRFKN